MRRLLPAIVTLGLFLGLAAPALASDRVPAGVKRISVTVTFPLKVNNTRKPVRKTLTKAAAVREVVDAADVLQTAKVMGACPMFMRLSPVLTVVFRGASGQKLAETQVQVVQGSRGTSGSSGCFPIEFTAGTHSQRLVGNSYVRLMGRLIGFTIS